MATPTYDLLDSTTLGTAAASVTFSGISGSYRDLVLVVEHKGNTANVSPNTTLNNDTGSNYPYVLAGGNGSSAFWGSGTGTKIFGTTATTTVAGLTQIQILDYSATDKHKPILLRRNRADNAVDMFAQRWANTTAVTEIDITASSDNFAAGSTFYLYAIAS